MILKAQRLISNWKLRIQQFLLLLDQKVFKLELCKKLALFVYVTAYGTSWENFDPYVFLTLNGHQQTFLVN